MFARPGAPAQVQGCRKPCESPPQACPTAKIIYIEPQSAEGPFFEATPASASLSASKGLALLPLTACLAAGPRGQRDLLALQSRLIL
jgi:hypothetical protein